MTPGLRCRDKEGNTSLHVAASLGHQHAVNLLYVNGGDLLLCNLKGETSVDVAHRNGHKKLASFLSKILDSESFRNTSEEKCKKFLRKYFSFPYT